MCYSSFSILIVERFFVYIFSGGYCNIGWHYYGGSCYKFGSALVNFTTASDVCMDNDATLSSVSSLEENEFLKQL